MNKQEGETHNQEEKTVNRSRLTGRLKGKRVEKIHTVQSQIIGMLV